jgi:two-component sensor histidine kinase
MFRSFLLRSFFIIPLLPATGLCQTSSLDINKQRLLLEISSCFLTATKDNAIDFDSALSVTSRSLGLSVVSVIAEGFDSKFLSKKKENLSAQGITQLKKDLLSTRGPDHTGLITLIGSYYAFHPGNSHAYLDSAYLFLRRANNEAAVTNINKWFYNSLCLLGKCFLKDKNFKRADSCFNIVINATGKAADKPTEAKALKYWGLYHPYVNGSTDERINHLKKAIALYRQVSDNENLSVVLNALGYLQVVKNNLKESRSSIMESLQLQLRMAFPYTHYSTNFYALLLELEDKLPEALKYALDAVKTATSLHDSLIYPYCYARPGEIYYALNGKEEEAITWYKKALEEVLKSGGDPVMYRPANAIANYLNKQGKSNEALTLIQSLLKKYPPTNVIHKQDIYFTLAQTYNYLGKYEQAEKYLLEAERLEKEAEAIRGSVFVLQLYANMGDFYLQRKQYDKSRFYYNKLLANSNFNYQVYYPTVQEALFKIDSAQGHFLSAINHYQEERRITDSVASVTTRQQMHELSLQYKTEQKDQNIRLLNKQSELQNAQLTQSRFNNNIIIAGIILLASLLALQYNRYRQKQKSTKLLHLKQEEINQKNARLEHLVKEKDGLIDDKDSLIEEKEWLLKEIHHRIKNNLQIMISLLNTQSKYLDSKEAIDAIAESKHRVQAMSLVHQKLYQFENTTFVNMQGYIAEFIDYLKSGFNLGNRIHFELQVTSIELDVSQAIPLSLILNEAITNTMKYAFGPTEKGTLSITMDEGVDGRIILEINDNGKGLPTGFDVTKSESMGIRLMKGLVKQLGGTFHLEDEQGVAIKIGFKRDAILKSISPTRSSQLVTWP